MLILAVKPGHDGAVAAIQDKRLLFSLEAEKDSFRRHRGLEVEKLVSAMELLPGGPDVVAVGGWDYAHSSTGAGYAGPEEILRIPTRMLGSDVTLFSSTHERSHILMALGMAPREDSRLRAVLVWEGYIGNLYLIEDNRTIKKRVAVLQHPGARWASLFGIADPTFPDKGIHRVEDSGKLMALAAFGDSADATPEIAETVELLTREDNGLTWYPTLKHRFRDSPVYNAGVEAEVTKVAAALLAERMFQIYADAAREHLPAGIPLSISGGCGLNCEWNAKWRELEHFSSVFVPPCTDDSGSALGTAIDALNDATGDPHIDWSVYSGLEFDWDQDPDSARWKRRPLDNAALAEAIADGHVVAWVQGRWEIGPRALGNRSLLADPFKETTRTRLNQIKQREAYRPIAPCCRLEDAPRLFSDGTADPYMLYFRDVTVPDLGAVTHVDGSARVQTVTAQTNRPLHDLLDAFAARCGVGVLCNTSLNYKGFGFINRMSNLVDYCELRGVSDFVVGDAWFQREPDDDRRGGDRAAGP